MRSLTRKPFRPSKIFGEITKGYFYLEEGWALERSSIIRPSFRNHISRWPFYWNGPPYDFCQESQVLISRIDSRKKHLAC